MDVMVVYALKAVRAEQAQNRRRTGAEQAPAM